ncbi:ribonuclease I [Halomonas elongata]|uniref:ribonuclease T2 family protein n=1 Tax=Halomonas elongata TaxID=2746 RepID=UPI002E27C171|nr:ribonuclease I [Halomonas elongata]WVI71788.1 ribonuclease I [Halomonas elongata]
MSLTPAKRADYCPPGRFWQALLPVLLSGMLLLGASPAWAEVPSIEAQGFDHYTLALTWHPGFCASRSRPPRECRDPGLRRGTEEGFVLHGLWPSLPQRLRERGVERRRWWRQGCFIERPRPDGGFCRHPSLELSDELTRELDSVMPGRASCLGRYQYAKHAACLDVAAEDLFDTSVALVEAVNASAFTDFLVIHRGGEVRRNALIEAFEAAFGKGTGRALRLECAGRGNRLLTEVRIGIAARSLENFPAADSLVRLDRGNCATRVRIAAFD